jgi:hypothetical protein
MKEEKLWTTPSMQIDYQIWEVHEGVVHAIKIGDKILKVNGQNTIVPGTYKEGRKQSMKKLESNYKTKRPQCYIPKVLWWIDNDNITSFTPNDIIKQFPHLKDKPKMVNYVISKLIDKNEIAQLGKDVFKVIS